MQIHRRTFLSSLTAAFAGCFGLVSAAKASTSKPLADYAELACRTIYKPAVAERNDDLVFWVGRNFIRQPVELWVIPSQLVREIPSRAKFIGAYEVREFFRTEHPVIMPATEFLIFPGPLTKSQRLSICVRLNVIGLSVRNDPPDEIPEALAFSDHGLIPSKEIRQLKDEVREKRRNRFVKIAGDVVAGLKKKPVI